MAVLMVKQDPNYPQLGALEAIYGPPEDASITVFDFKDLEDSITKRCGRDIWLYLVDMVADRDNEDKDSDAGTDSDLDSAYEEIRHLDNEMETVRDRIRDIRTEIQTRSRFTAKYREELTAELTRLITILEDAGNLPQ